MIFKFLAFNNSYFVLKNLFVRDIIIIF